LDANRAGTSHKAKLSGIVKGRTFPGVRENNGIRLSKFPVPWTSVHPLPLPFIQPLGVLSVEIVLLPAIFDRGVRKTDG